MKDPMWWQWFFLLVFGGLFYFVAPHSRTVSQFFSASSGTGGKPGVFLLTSSLVISWIFAKSITNAANLGLAFGLVGGVAYGVYYLSFVVGGLVIYQLRTRGGYNSIHDFLGQRFGRAAVIIFSLLIALRLFNEVWSNTMVIGSYFGEAGSSSYYLAILVFTALTLAYTLKGGLRSSLLTDAVQMLLFGVLLVLLLQWILPDSGSTWQAYTSSGTWALDAGLDLLLVALLQVFSYPFHDPVLTDRGFISTPNVTLRSYLLAALIGFVCIVAFSLIGVYAQLKGLEGQAAVEVSKLLGTGSMLAMNFIMVTSASSTLDSTFSSFSKLVVIDLGVGARQTVQRGRLAMVLLVLLGTLPVFANPEILSATTLSGTMVMGLAPVFLFWRWRAPRLSYHLPIGFGVLTGLMLAAGQFPDVLIYTKGAYADVLWANAWGLLLCVVLFFIPIAAQQWNERNR